VNFKRSLKHLKLGHIECNTPSEVEVGWRLLLYKPLFNEERNGNGEWNGETNSCDVKNCENKI